MKPEKLIKTNEEWKKMLTPEQFNILRLKGTEPAFRGKFLDNKKKGIYVCVACKNSVFNSKDKYISGTGWPSFSDVISNEHIILQLDEDGMRTEVLCAKCEGHLGHVFNDGPKPTGKRYCINGIVLEFKEEQ